MVLLISRTISGEIRYSRLISGRAMRNLIRYSRLISGRQKEPSPGRVAGEVEIDSPALTRASGGSPGDRVQ